jgi:hypothetical protein
MISDLQPEQREAAERLLGQSLAEYQKVAIHIPTDGMRISVSFFKEQNGHDNQQSARGWQIPSCFDVLSDLDKEELANYDVVVSIPTTLSRPH